MKNSEYWTNRISILENAQTKKNIDYFNGDLEKIYQKAIGETEKDIAKWYTRFATENGVSMAEAKKMLSGRELKEFKWTVEEYIDYGKKNAVSGEWMKQLENASARYHVSRLESLKLQMQNHVEVLMGNEVDGVTDLMRQHLEDGYYKTAFEVQKFTGLGSSFSQLDNDQIERILSKPWAPDGTNFSERIWGNHRTELVNDLHAKLTRAIIMGDNPKVLAKGFAKYVSDEAAKSFKSKKSRAENLIMTETSFFRSEGQRKCYNDLGVDEFENCATLDSRTSETCRDMDGTHFLVKDMKPGVNCPPFHNRCRTATCPYFDDEFTLDEVRAARADDDSYYTVPANMQYREWKSKYVDNISDADYFKNAGKHYIDFYNTDRKLTYKESNIIERQEELNDKRDNIQVEMNNLEAKEYADIWKDPVTIKDYESKADRIQAKRDYFENQYNKTGDYKFKILLDDLSEFEANGKKYLTLKSELSDVIDEIKDLPEQLKDVRKQIMDHRGINPDNMKSKIDKLKGKLANLKKPLDVSDKKALANYRGNKARWTKELKALQDEYDSVVKRFGLEIEDDRFAKARKAAAKIWDKRTEADKYYRALLDKEWNNYSEFEKYSIWQYTRNSHPINKPLSGYEHGWDRGSFKGLGKADWNSENSWRNFRTRTFETKFGVDDHVQYDRTIKDLTKAIDKSAFIDDVWLVRGSDENGLAGLLEGDLLSFDDAKQLLNKSEDKIKNALEGQIFTNHAFTSTGIASNAGFDGSVKYKIYAPKGTKGVYSEPTSYFGQTVGKNERLYEVGDNFNYVGGEAEVILQRGTQFRITNVEVKNGE